VLEPRAGKSAFSSLSRLLALFLTLAFVAAACGGGDDDDDGEAQEGLERTEARDEGEPQQGGSITVGLEAETQNWSPPAGNFASSSLNVAYSIYDPLIARDENGELQPYLAESLEPNDELTEWTLTLRPGVTFHDGTPLDAEAIAHNVEQLTAEASTQAAFMADVDTFEVTGELTGVYRLSRPNAAFPDILRIAPGMPFSPTAYDADPEGFGDNPVGTGPFEFVSWQRDAQLRVEAYDDYWQEGMPYLESITFQPIPDEDARLSSLLTGDVDAMTTLRQAPVQQALQAEEDGTVETNVFVGNNSGSAVFNTAVPPLDDVRVRQALAYALNQDDLIEILDGTGITPPHTQYASADNPFYSEAAAEAWPSNDPERAQELVEEYVNDPDRSDGQAVGDPISFEFICPADATLLALSEAYQAFWNAVGMEVSLRQVDQATLIAEIQGTPDDDYTGSYEAGCFRLGDESDPYTVLSTLFGEPAESPQNWTNYTSDVVQQNLDTLRTSADVDERQAAFEEMMLHLAENVPNTWTAGTASMIATRPEVNGVASWTLPDGTPGEGTPEARGRWGHVWLGEE
jgi:peptide/nickel transport system substrate-binding protein